MSAKITARISRQFIPRLVSRVDEEISPAVNRRFDRYFSILDAPEVTRELASRVTQEEMTFLGNICRTWIEPAAEARAQVSEAIARSPLPVPLREALVDKVNLLSTAAFFLLLETFEAK